MLRIFKNQFMDEELSRGIESFNLVKKRLYYFDDEAAQTVSMSVPHANSMVRDKDLRELGIKNVL